jgi:hypothetical protein
MARQVMPVLSTMTMRPAARVDYPVSANLPFTTQNAGSEPAAPSTVRPANGRFLMLHSHFTALYEAPWVKVAVAIALGLGTVIGWEADRRYSRGKGIF